MNDVKHPILTGFFIGVLVCGAVAGFLYLYFTVPQVNPDLEEFNTGIGYVEEGEYIRLTFSIDSNIDGVCALYYKDTRLIPEGTDGYFGFTQGHTDISVLILSPPEDLLKNISVKRV